MQPKDILTKEFLIEYYINQKLSVSMIAEITGIKSSNSVTQFIKKFGLYRKSRKDFSEILTEEYLIENYINQKKSTYDIATEIGSSKANIRRYLDFYNIPLRPKKDHSPKALKSFKREWYEGISKKYWSSLEFGARNRNLEFNITIEDGWNLYILQDKRCALSGVDIVFAEFSKYQIAQTASLDRIDSSKGYTIENIQWIHKAIQKMKWAYNEEEFIDWCVKIADHKGRKPLL